MALGTNPKIGLVQRFGSIKNATGPIIPPSPLDNSFIKIGNNTNDIIMILAPLIKAVAAAPDWT